MTKEQTTDRAALELTDGLCGAVIGEAWVIWYDGTDGHGYTPNYLHHNSIVLFPSEAAAQERCMRPQYTPVKVHLCLPHNA